MTTKVLYICPGTYLPSDGIYQKVNLRTSFWNQKGIITRVVTYSDIPLNSFHRLMFSLKWKAISTVYQYILFARTINKINKSFQADLIYTRHFLMPHRVKHSGPLILEINGDMEAENQNSPKLIKRLVKNSIHFYNQFASALILVGANMDKSFPNVKVKKIIPNPILNSSDKVLTNFRNRTQNDSPTFLPNVLVFMASKDRWYYPIENVISLVSKLKTPHELWVIGNINQKKIKNLKSENVYFWGPQYGKNLSKLLSLSKAAIGVLNFYPGASASALKTRTYLEHGVPVFGLDCDPDYNKETPYYKCLPHDSMENLDIAADELDNFLNSTQVNNPEPMDKLPDSIKNTCIDIREYEVVDLIRNLIKT